MSALETSRTEQAETNGPGMPDHRAASKVGRVTEVILRALAHDLRGDLNTVMLSAANSTGFVRTLGVESSRKIVEKQQRVMEVVRDASAKIDACTALFDASDTDIKSRLEWLASLLCKHRAVADIHVSVDLPAQSSQTLEDYISPVVLALLWISNGTHELEQAGSALDSAVFYVTARDLKGKYSLGLSRRDHSVDDREHRSILSINAATEQLLSGYSGPVAIQI